MSRLSSILDTSILQEADSHLSSLGIDPFFMPTLRDWDFDPDGLVPVVENVRETAQQLQTTYSLLGNSTLEGVGWQGQAQRAAAFGLDDITSWLKGVGDALLGVVEWVVTLADTLVDGIRSVAKFLFELLSELGVVLTIVAIISAGGAALGYFTVAAASMAMLMKIIAIVGILAALAAIIWAVLTIIHNLLNWLKDRVRDGREQLEETKDRPGEDGDDDRDGRINGDDEEKGCDADHPSPAEPDRVPFC